MVNNQLKNMKNKSLTRRKNTFKKKTDLYLVFSGRPSHKLTR